MNNRTSMLSLCMRLYLVIAALTLGTSGMAHAGAGFGIYADGTCTNPTFYANSPAGTWKDACGATHNSGTALRKFVDSLPGLGGPTAGIPAAGANNIPIAIANTPYRTIPGVDPYPGSDYYEIGVVEYTQKMHTDLPKATRLRGYVQLVPAGWSGGTDALGNTYTAVPLKNLDGTNLVRNGVQYYGATQPRYLGPVITATKGKPVRIKYTNLLPSGAAGNLFIPTDKTLMGTNVGPDGSSIYTENRIAVHLHGGFTPWISDGTPHQWIVPVDETSTIYTQGASFQNVPDMVNPGQGSGTLYYTNDQASRLMFYHDHALGITRLNVYAGLAAGYLLQDQTGTGEDWLVKGGNKTYPVPGGTKNVTVPSNVIPGLMDEIPIVIQDKTFVPNDVGPGTDPITGLPTPGQDAMWNTAAWGAPGDLWFPHVYEINQDPYNPSGHAIDGTNPVGRWDYGPWFWPVFPVPDGLPTGAYGDVSTTPEAFMDTPLVNGVAYPTVTVNPKAYRFRILNAANDRMFNLGLYQAEPLTVAVTNGGAGYPQPTPPALGLPVTFSPTGATAYATVSTGSVTAIPITTGGQGYNPLIPPAITVAPPPGPGVRATATAVIGSGPQAGQILGVTITNAGSGYNASTPPAVIISAPPCSPPDPCSQAVIGPATVANPGTITGVTVTAPGTYTAPPTVTIPGGTTPAQAYATLGTEVKMVNFDASYVPPATISPDGNPGFPATGGLMDTGWGFPDGRVGGVPDPATAGPPIIQIGTEGGLLPMPVIIPSTPINYEYNKRSVTVLNVLEHGLLLGPAERADAVVDFCRYAGKTLILYNDSPAPVPAGDPRLDYYTGNPDQSAFGGMASTLPGFGPNTRTIMQIKVNPGGCIPYNPSALFTYLPAAYGQTQETPVVGETVYNTAFNTTIAADQYARIYTGASLQPEVTWTDGNGAAKCYSVSGTCCNWSITGGTGTCTAPARPADGLILNKAIQELFDSHGRMNATLGVELPFTSALNQTTIPLAYIDPTTETIKDGETQIWKITHNGVDSHPVHFHLVNVQVLNRVGWDGTVKPPADNEVGWKETVRMNPLEDIIVAVRAKAPTLPFAVPTSIRYMDPTQAPNSQMGFTQIDPTTGNPALVTNQLADYGWEYVWHCHILGHEESDFMRPVAFQYKQAAPGAPVLVSATPVSPVRINLLWTRTAPWEIGFNILRANVTNGVVGPFTQIGSAIAGSTTYADLTVTQGRTYAYQVVAYNTGGSTPSNVLQATTPAGIPTAPRTLTATASPSGQPTQVVLNWVNSDINLTGATIQRATNLGFTTGLTSFTVTAANPTTYTDTTAQPTTTYYYRVLVSNIAGSSAWSNTAPVTTQGVIGAVTNLRTTLIVPTSGGLANGQVIMTWNIPTGAQGYYVERKLSTSSIWTQIATTTVNTYRNTGLARGTYNYRVRAYIGANTGPYSNTLTVTIN